MRQTWQAGGLRDADPVSTWADGLASAFVRLDFEGRRGEPFAGAIDQADVGSLKISRVRAAPHGVRRRAEHVRSSATDLVFVNLQVSGVGATVQHNREWRTAPFDLAIADTLVPFGIAHQAPFELICAAIPRASVPSALIDRGGLRLSRSVQGREFAKLMLGYVTLALSPETGAAAANLAARHFLDLLTLATSEVDGSPNTGRSELAACHIRDYIARTFRDPNLNAARAARTFGVSERHVQKLLAGGGETFSELLASARLEASAQTLVSANVDLRPVSEIAYACGFSDLSHFHRAFKARFRETPAAYRQMRRV